MVVLEQALDIARAVGRQYRRILERATRLNRKGGGSPSR